jgi:hypothetical protein
VLTLYPPQLCRADDDRLCQDSLLRKGVPCDDAVSAAACPVSFGLCKPGVFGKRNYTCLANTRMKRRKKKRR